MSSDREASFEARFAQSCIARRERILALLQQGGMQKAPEMVAETIRIEAHSLAGEAALLRLETVHDAAALLENLFERDEVRAGGEALMQAVGWFEQLTELAGRGPQGGEIARRALQTLAKEIGEAASADNWWLAPPGGEDEAPEPGGEARPRVLILDDSEISREAMAGILEERNYPVETAGDLLEFEELLASFRPEVVLSDLNMPDIQGDEICRTLKQRFETEGVPIILISSLPDEELAVRAQAAGADGFVSKHHGPDSLLDLLDELLSQIIF
ncbi:MAG: response regulator [Deltaproteobacteria bacterium]|nr:response regulator [Deltaproteobacteria bacterium]